MHEDVHIMQDINAFQNIQGTVVKHNLQELYNALKLQLPSRNMQVSCLSDLNLYPTTSIF